PAAAANSRTRPGSRARRRGSAPPFDPGPLLLTPASDLGLIRFGRAAGGPLGAPAESAQQPPYVPGVVPHPGQLLDYGRDPGQGPQLGVEPERLWSLAERLGDRLQLRLGQPRAASRPTSGAQRRLAALAPAAIPGAGGLGRDPEGVGHFGLAGAVGKHAGGFQTALLQAGEVAPPGPCLDRHGNSLQVQYRSLQPQHVSPNTPHQPIERSSLSSTESSVKARIRVRRPTVLAWCRSAVLSRPRIRSTPGRQRPKGAARP